MFTSIARTAVVAWSPRGYNNNNPLLATASLSGSLGSDFDSTARLEIFNPHATSAPIASTELQERARAMSWGGRTIAVSVSGALLLFDSQQLEQRPRVVAHEPLIDSLDFNAAQEGLLATGGASAEVLVWDTNNETVKSYAPGPRANNAASVSSVMWNPRVSRILASSCGSSATVWDLRVTRAVAQLSDRRCAVVSSVAWHPDTATLIATASGDDKSPVVLLWDLRAAQHPISSLEAHRKSVKDISWNPTNHNLLATCGSDGRVLLWDALDPKEPSLCKEVEVTTSDPTSVQWADGCTMSVAAADGPVKLLSCFDPCTKQAPLWMKRRSSVCFGGGGRLVHTTSAIAHVHRLSARPDLVAAANQFDVVLAEGKQADWARERANEEKDETKRMQWLLLAAQSPQQTIAALGFDVSSLQQSINSLRVDDTKQKPVEATIEHKQPDDTVTSDKGVSGLFDTTSNDFFSDLAAKDDFPDWTTNNNETVDQTKPLPLHSTDHVDDLITQAVIAGQWELAATCAINANRWADALLIASHGSDQLRQSVTEQYVRSNKTVSSSVLHALREDAGSAASNGAAAGDWKRALVLAASHSTHNLHQSAAAIASQLRHKGDQDAATAASIVARDPIHLIHSDQHNDQHNDHLMSLVLATQRAAVIAPPPVQSSANKLAESYQLYAHWIALAGSLEAARRFDPSIPSAATRHNVNPSPSPFEPFSQHNHQTFDQHNQPFDQLSNQQLIDQSFNQTNNQSFNQPINQTNNQFPPSNQTINPSFNQTFNQPPINQPINQYPPTNQTFTQPPINQSFNQPPINQTNNQTNNQTTFNQPINPTFNQPPLQPINQSFNQPPINQPPINQPINQTISQQNPVQSPQKPTIKKESAAAFKHIGVKRLVEYASTLAPEKQQKFLSDFIKRLGDVDQRCESSALIAQLINALADAISSNDSNAITAAFHSILVTNSEAIGASAVVAFRRLEQARK